MTTKIFDITGSTQIVFPSDVPIKGKDYVAIYISATGTTYSYERVLPHLYAIVNDTVVFTGNRPTGITLRLVVATHLSEILSTPDMITLVGANMEVLKKITDNLDELLKIAETL